MESTAGQPVAIDEAFSRTRITLAVLIAGSIVTYLSRFGHEPLGASEAFSAWAAAKPSLRAIIAIPVLYDPGKQLLYYIALHYYTGIFGASEMALRSLSLLFAIGSIGLVYIAGRDLFDAETGVAAVAIWCFNPLAMIFAYRARGYAMLLFMALAQLIAMWRVRERPSAGRALWCGLLGAALLFTHMSGILLLGVEGGMLLRDLLRGRSTSYPWIAMVVTAVLFAPYLPIAMTQSHQLVSGHWLDWIGTRHYSIAERAAAALLAAVLGVAMVFGPRIENARAEPLRWIAAWSLLPLIGLLAGSVVMRPMFTPRYVLPSFAGLAILTADILALWSTKLRNLAAAGFAIAFIMMMPYTHVASEPWPALVSAIDAAKSPAQPIFFETGFVAHGAAGKVPNGGFPFGYYSIPFNYYFHGPNPRVTIPGHDPAAARAIIERDVGEAGGGWLVSWKEGEVKPELPDARQFRIKTFASQPELAIYRIVPITSAH